MKNAIINENGIVTATIRLPLRRRRNTKITRMTIMPPTTTVSLRLLSDCMIKTEVSKNSVRTTSFGRRLLNWAILSFTLFATNTLLAPDCFCTINTRPLAPFTLRSIVCSLKLSSMVDSSQNRPDA